MTFRKVKINFFIATLLFAFTIPNYVSATTIKNFDNYALINGISVKQTQKMVSKIDKIKEIIPKNVSDVEKVLTIYDYVASNVQYDLYKYDNTAFGALVKKKAKCVGYAMAVRQLCLEYDIPNVILVSRNANHVWNAVKLDGEWYHLDATWGATGRTGEVNHDYFLISTSRLLRLDPRRKDAKMYGVFTDDSYENPKHSYLKNAFWKKTNSVAYYYKGKYYFAAKKTGKINKYNFRTGKQKTVYKKEFTWYTDDEQFYYNDKFITLAGFKNKLFFNTPKDVRVMNLDTKKTKIVCKIRNKSEKLYGLTKNDKKCMVLGFSKNPADDSNRIYIKNYKNLTKKLNKMHLIR